jgi:DNA-binding PadR family transcriptional regulator
MQVLDDLEARGLLSAREGKENDQDSTEFNLTAEGRELAERISQVAANIEEHMQELLGISGAIALRTLLQRFVRDTTNARSVDWL